ncbi:MAG TPA: PadR family transcriptional regulator [Bryobacteraceae bacterium]|nr:PadR family transcriptional regulator [Bryobacterales bacterium]HRJ18120.1 PadR family transcriptional regulator [Bryobacteraceae bacterium]
MQAKKTDLVQGTLDLLVLKTVAQGPIHGYGIAQRILVTSREMLQVQQGSLYPALHRLERKGLIQAEWRESGNGPMAKYYSLTEAGQTRLRDEMEQWRRYSSAIELVLES